jgi:hypothetical protein
VDWMHLVPSGVQFGGGGNFALKKTVMHLLVLERGRYF